MQEVVILTGNELRHRFFRKAVGLSESVRVLRSYCEGLEDTTLDRVRREGSEIQVNHLLRRARVEHDFFGAFDEFVPDESSPEVIPRGDINGEEYYEEILELDPDLLVAYGCSIIQDPLLSEYQGRFLNVHLGLSPYYRGTGTNFWPLVNGEPEYVGATFMHIDEGVDTGEVIHQIRARIYSGDGPHQIGNRLIADMTRAYVELIREFDELEEVEQPPEPEETRYYRKDDYSTEATRQLYRNFEEGMVEDYLGEQEERVRNAPIARNPVLEGAVEIPTFGLDE